MAHVDDGTLNALLDGELEAAEAASVRAHVAACAECGARFEEARRFLDAAAELLGVLTPPAEVRPERETPAPAPAARPGAASVAGPGAAPAAVPAAPNEPAPPATSVPLVAPVSPVGPATPAALGAPSGPPRRVPKTAKEVAIDIDGATQKSPAIAPNFPRAGESIPGPEARPSDGGVLPLAAAGRRPARRRAPSWSTLAWAASLILALSVGYMGNEVMRGRFAAAPRGERVAPEAGGPVSQAPGPSRQAPARPSTTPPAAATRGGPANAAAAPKTAQAEGRRPAETAALDAAAPAAGREREDFARLAREAAGQGAPTQPSAPSPGPSGAAGARAAVRAPVPARTPSTGANRGQRAPTTPTVAARRVNDRLGAAAEAPSQTVPQPSFRASDADSAAVLLGGQLRVIEGLFLESVKIGPGALVPGALPTRDVVRLVFSDPAGGTVNLDQQLLTMPRDTGRAARARAIPASLGLAFGDTLVTTEPSGEARVRWLDRSGRWMSLSGSLPADSLRGLLERIR